MSRRRPWLSGFAPNGWRSWLWDALTYPAVLRKVRQEEAEYRAWERQLEALRGDPEAYKRFAAKRYSR